MSRTDAAGDERRPGDEDRGGDLGTATTALAAIAAVAIGAGIGASVPTAGAVVGIALVLAGTRALSSDSPLAGAAGSCGFAAGLVALAAALPVGGPAPTSVAIAALGAVAVAGTGAAMFVPENRLAIASRTLRDSTIVAAVVGVATAALVYGAVGVLVRVAAVAVAALSRNPFEAFLSTVVLAVVAVLLFELGRSTFERWLPPSVRPPSIAPHLADALAPPYSGSVPFLAMVVVLTLAFVDVSGTFESALEALGPVGAAVAWTLQSGLLPGSIALLVLVMAGILAADAFRPAVRAWLGSYPLRTLALSTGGFAVALVGVPAAALVPAVPSAAVLPAVGGLFVAFVFLETVRRFASAVSLPLRRTALAVGATALFAAATVGALSGLEPIGVFAGVAVSILVWDLGENGLALRRQLGAAVDTREVELAHATGSTLVGIGGVAVAAVAIYVVGAVPAPDARWQAMVPLVLALAALVVLAVAVQRGPRSVLGNVVDVGSLDPAGWPARHPKATVAACVTGVLAVLVAMGYGALVFVVLIFLGFGLILLMGGGYTGDRARRY